MKVIIIGAGTGGMCLAHGLRRAGVEVAVHERDRTRTSGLHGYRVGIDPHGSRALKACLPPELYRTFVATPESVALMPPGLFPGIGLILAPRGMACILHWMEFPWTAQGRPKDGIGAADAELIERWPGLLFDNTRDYLNWGLSAATTRFPPDVTDLKGPDLMRLATRMTPRWDARLHRLFALTDPTTCFPMTIRTSVRPAPWPSDNVTLLGDAIHTMTPGQGVGANTALRDAHNLVRELTSGRPLPTAVAAYERAMVEYAFAAVEASKRQTGGEQWVHKPLVGRLALAGQRTFLRATGRIPALRRKFERELYDVRGTDAA